MMSCLNVCIYATDISTYLLFCSVLVPVVSGADCLSRSPSFLWASEGPESATAGSAQIASFLTSPTGFFGGPAASLAARSFMKLGLSLGNGSGSVEEVREYKKE